MHCYEVKSEGGSFFNMTGMDIEFSPAGDDEHLRGRASTRGSRPTASYLDRQFNQIQTAFMSQFVVAPTTGQHAGARHTRRHHLRRGRNRPQQERILWVRQEQPRRRRMEEDHVRATIVEPKDLPPIWEEVSELLELACERSFGQDTIKTLRASLMSGNEGMFVIEEGGDIIGAVTYEVIGYDTG